MFSEVTVRGRVSTTELAKGQMMRVEYTDRVRKQIEDGNLDLVAWHIDQGQDPTTLVGTLQDENSSQRVQCDHVCAHPPHAWINHESGELYWCTGREEDQPGTEPGGEPGGEGG